MVLLAAVAVFALATVGLALLIEPIPGWYYTLAWWSYIVAADDANRRLGGRSLLRDRFRHLAYLAYASVLWWTLFEIVNLRLGNWYYVMSPAGRSLRWVSGVVAFATVLPAIVVTVGLIENLGWLRTVRATPLTWTPRKRLVVLALCTQSILPRSFTFPPLSSRDIRGLRRRWGASSLTSNMISSPMWTVISMS